MPKPIDLGPILAQAPELTQVEKLIHSRFVSDASLMRDIPEYLLGLGGKRIRPCLSLLCGKALLGESLPEELVTISAGIELIHMATLLHDDIIDNSELRRHKPSPLAKYGMPATLLSGDFLLVRAFGLCASLDEAIIHATERACIELVEGETLETSLYQENHTVESSLVIARKKTASLFQLGAFSAAHIARAHDDEIQAFSLFGQKIGLAFQVLDDILDVASSDEILGKKCGSDIHERKPSIVNVLWLQSGDPAARRLLECPSGDEDAFIGSSIQYLRSSQVLAEAKNLAATLATEALRNLEIGLKRRNHDSPAALALRGIVEFTLERMA